MHPFVNTISSELCTLNSVHSCSLKVLFMKKAIFRFIILVLCALALQGIPALFLLWEGDGAVALYVIYLYAVLPIMAAVIPFWCGLGGVHPMAAFFPIGGALLLLPVYHSPGMGILCMALSLVGAVAGQEWKKRRETEKGKHHGGEKKRK